MFNMSYDIGSYVDLSNLNKKTAPKQVNFLASSTLFDIPSKIRFYNWLQNIAVLDAPLAV